MNILFLNFLFYLCWFAVVWKNVRKPSLYIMMVAFLLSIAFLGWYTVENGIYYNVFGKYNVDSLSVEPYIYCFLAYLLMVYPLKKLSKEQINIDGLLENKRFEKFLVIWIVFISCYLVLKLAETYITISTGLSEAYESRHIEGETLFEYNNILLNQLNGKGFFILNATTPLIMAYSFIGLYKKKVSTRFALFLIALCFIPPILSSISQGTRGGLFMNMFCFLFFVLVFNKYISRNNKKKLLIFSFLLISVIITYSWLITTERFGSNSKSTEGVSSILRYFGEAFPNLGFRIWDNVINHPMGKRLFPDFFETTKNALSIHESYLYWEQITGVPVINFKTYFGDLYIEYGLIGAFVFILFISIIFKIINKAFGITIYTLPILYIYFQLCVYSFAGFTKGGWHTIFQLIIILTINYWIKYHVSKKRQ